MKRTPIAASLVGLLVFGMAAALDAERLGYSPEEFVARRRALAQRLGEGLVVMFGKTMPALGVRNRQDNDFFYLTGNEDLNAAVVMDATTAESHLFLPRQNASEIRSDGRNWLEFPEMAARRGLESIRPLAQLGEFLARRRVSSGSQVLWMRLSEADEVDQSRTNKTLHLGRRLANPFGGPPSEDAWRVEAVRARFPYYELRDVSPEIDRLRTIKSTREIEVLTLNGRLSAEAIVRAMAVTRSGRFEYELEAEATYHLLRNGVQGNGYPAIVGSGPNGNIWHYNDNGKVLADGELVVMDYGGSLDYLVADITRTWPVSGRFDDLQRRAYTCALEAQKAIIAAMRPGATRADTRAIGEAIYRKHGFPGRAGAGHFVGMAVHDVGDDSRPFEPGMVIAVEPIVEDASRALHVRIEDTVVITDGAPVVLTAAAPKEVEDVLARIGRGSKN